MRYEEFPETTQLNDDDQLLIQESSTLAIKRVKLSALKQYIGVNSALSVSPVAGASKWYRMDEITIAGGAITSIKDKATGNDLTPISGNPTLIVNAINNKSVANFNNCAMKHNGETYAIKHAFVVYRNNVEVYSSYNAYIATRAIYVDKGSPSNEMIIISGSENKPNIYGESSTKGYLDKIEQNINAFKDYAIGVSAGAVGQFHIVESVFANSVSGTKNLCVGADNNSSGRYLQNADIAEIIIYPNELSATERSTMYSYFKSYYNFNFL